MSDETRPREEHLAWCKKRALEYLTGDPKQALTSMMSDLDKHPGTRNHAGSLLGLEMLMGGLLGTPDEMRRFIEGFH